MNRMFGRFFNNLIAFINRSFLYAFVVFALFAGLSGSLAGCGRMEPVSGTDIALDTVVSITIYDGNDKSSELIKNSIELTKHYEKLFSAHEEGTDIYRINHANGEAVNVDPETAELINVGLYYSDLSGGKFDITCGRLNDLWHVKDNNGYVPSEEEINESLRSIDYKNVEVIRQENKNDTAKLSGQDKNISNDKAETVTYQVLLKNPETHLDLGAIAKGYIADRIKEYLVGEGVRSAMINLGGNVLLIGGKSASKSSFYRYDRKSSDGGSDDKSRDGEDFVIGIPTPFDTEKIAKTVYAKDKSIVTSGNYQRYFEKDGVIYHHIMDLETGYPADSGVLSVSIVADKSVDADALSTICFILGETEGDKFISDNGIDAKAIWIAD